MSAFKANKKGFVYAIKGETNDIILLAYKINKSIKTANIIHILTIINITKFLKLLGKLKVIGCPLIPKKHLRYFY
jgi:hypothetical protein